MRVFKPCSGVLPLARFPQFEIGDMDTQTYADTAQVAFRVKRTELRGNGATHSQIGLVKMARQFRNHYTANEVLGTALRHPMGVV